MQSKKALDSVLFFAKLALQNQLLQIGILFFQYIIYQPLKSLFYETKTFKVLPFAAILRTATGRNYRFTDIMR